MRAGAKNTRGAAALLIEGESAIDGFHNLVRLTPRAAALFRTAKAVRNILFYAKKFAREPKKVAPALPQ
jgi:hypothetical protein